VRSCRRSRKKEPVTKIKVAPVPVLRKHKSVAVVNSYRPLK
jgi:hypothetical protein